MSQTSDSASTRNNIDNANIRLVVSGGAGPAYNIINNVNGGKTNHIIYRREGQYCVLLVTVRYWTLRCWTVRYWTLRYWTVGLSGIGLSGIELSDIGLSDIGLSVLDCQVMDCQVLDSQVLDSQVLKIQMGCGQ